MLSICLQKAHPEAECEVTDRTIHLTEAGCKALDTFFAVKPAFRDADAMGRALKRAAVKAGLKKPEITSKMYPEDAGIVSGRCKKQLGIDTLEICSNLGHDERTLRKHYYGIFTGDAEHREILKNSLRVGSDQMTDIKLLNDPEYRGITKKRWQR